MAKITNSELTPSAKVLQRMRELKTPYFQFAMNQSLAHSDYFRGLKLSTDKMTNFEIMSQTANQQRINIEQLDKLDFATYLHNMNNS